MGLRNSTTTDQAFQHLQAPSVIPKSVFKLKMVGVNFWNFWWRFSICCEKRQNVCSVAANPEQMDTNGCDRWTQRPPKPPNPLQTKSPQKSCIPLNYQLQLEKQIIKSFVEPWPRINNLHFLLLMLHYPLLVPSLNHSRRKDFFQRGEQWNFTVGFPLFQKGNCGKVSFSQLKSKR